MGMKNSKRKNAWITTGAILYLVIVGICIMLFGCRETESACALEISKCSVEISFSNYCIENTGNDTSKTVYKEGLNTVSPEVFYMEDEITNLSIFVSAENCIKNTLKNGDALKTTSLFIETMSAFNICTMSVKDSFGKQVGFGQKTVSMKDLSDGLYNVMIILIGMPWSIDEATSAYYGATATFSFVIDTVAPTGILFAGNTQVNSGTIVTANFIKYVAADLQSGVQTIYVKKPGAKSYIAVANGSEFTQDGLYSFYCTDKAGGISSTVFITLDNSNPVGRIVHSDSDNRVYFTWDNSSWTAKLNGTTYTKNTWITKEGSYTVTLSNAVGKSTTYDFTIEHYFVKQEEVAPTCTEEGYNLYACISCAQLKKEITTKAKGHTYTATVLPQTCTTGAATQYTCAVCDYSFTNEESLPAGHELVSKVTHAANCTESGNRHYACEKCDYEYDEEIQSCGHMYLITDTYMENDNINRIYTCSVCGDSYVQEMGQQYEKVSNYVEYLFGLYKPYMVWVFIATAGVWSIVLGVMIILAYKNEDKEKARKMLINYAVGMAIIFGILVACPYLVRGIAYLVT